MRNEPDAYLFHEHLEENNHAFYFHEFADAAKRHGLEYLAEADLSDMLVSNFPPEVAADAAACGDGHHPHGAVHGLRAQPPVPADAARASGRTYPAQPRWPDAVKGSADHFGSSARIGAARPGARRERDVPRPQAVAKHNIVDALTKSALLVMGARWPQCLPFEELTAMSPRPPEAGDRRCADRERRRKVVRRPNAAGLRGARRGIAGGRASARRRALRATGRRVRSPGCSSRAAPRR